MYKITVSDAYYVYDKESEALEWATDVKDKNGKPYHEGKFDSKEVEEHETLAAALESMNEWGSRWAMYSSVSVDDEEHGEVYSSYPALYKCECCGNEKWNSVESDMRRMKSKDGTPLFPEIV